MITKLINDVYALKCLTVNAKQDGENVLVNLVNIPITIESKFDIRMLNEDEIINKYIKDNFDKGFYINYTKDDVKKVLIASSEPEVLLEKVKTYLTDKYKVKSYNKIFGDIEIKNSKVKSVIEDIESKFN